MLKKCPCCAGEALLSTKSLDERSSYATVATVCCQSCGLQISKKDVVPDRGYAVKDSGKNAAIDAWNKRV